LVYLRKLSEIFKHELAKNWVDYENNDAIEIKSYSLFSK
jgi:hypothetical protein